jgi:hypothetical protein
MDEERRRRAADREREQQQQQRQRERERERERAMRAEKEINANRRPSVGRPMSSQPSSANRNITQQQQHQRGSLWDAQLRSTERDHRNSVSKSRISQQPQQQQSRISSIIRRFAINQLERQYTDLRTQYINLHVSAHFSKAFFWWVQPVDSNAASNKMMVSPPPPKFALSINPHPSNTIPEFENPRTLDDHQMKHNVRVMVVCGNPAFASDKWRNGIDGLSMLVAEKDGHTLAIGIELPVLAMFPIRS